MELKKCSKCEASKSLDDFTKRSDNGKYLNKCKVCMNEEQRIRRAAKLEVYKAREQKYREANRDKIRQQYKSPDWHREYYQANRDEILAKHRDYNTANAEAISKQKQEYYITNKEHILKRSSTYSKANPDVKAAACMKRKAVKLQATPKWLTAEDWYKIRLMYKIAAKVTAQTGIKMHVDHIYPLQGKTVCGLHCPDNLQILTETENLSKGNSLPD